MGGPISFAGNGTRARTTGVSINPLSLASRRAGLAHADGEKALLWFLPCGRIDTHQEAQLASRQGVALLTRGGGTLS